jgi:hypothetical protein
MTTALATPAHEASTALADAARLERHEVALLVGGRCRACAERLPGGALLRGEPCPLCRSPTAFDAADRALLLDHLEHRGHVRVGLLAAAVGLSHLLVGWLPVASSVVVAASTAWVRFQIVQPASRLLSPRRRRVAVWTARIGTSALVALTLVVNEILTLVPFVGAVVKGIVAAAQVLLVAWANARYLRWQLGRDEAMARVGWWEYALLVGASGTLVGAVIGVVTAAAAAVVAIQTYAPRLLH